MWNDQFKKENHHHIFFLEKKNHKTISIFPIKNKFSIGYD